MPGLNGWEKKLVLSSRGDLWIYNNVARRTRRSPERAEGFFPEIKKTPDRIFFGTKK